MFRGIHIRLKIHTSIKTGGGDVKSVTDKMNEHATGEDMKLQSYQDDQGKFISHAFPGGYPVYYQDACGNVLCADCANKPSMLGSAIVAGEVYWEGPPLACDNCPAFIESSYGDPDEE